MPIITTRREAQSVMDDFAERGASMAVFCTAGHWNTEAILLAANAFAKKHSMEGVAVTVAMTNNYPYMSQTRRMTYSGDAKAGFLSMMGHLYELCGENDSPYANITALPHLDHADPSRDLWALTAGAEYLASAMFDAQKYTDADNLALTAEYVRAYGPDLLVEGIMETLSVQDHAKGAGDADNNYVTKAVDFRTKTGVDYLVADLGTEQQSSAQAGVYLRDRARALTKELGIPMLTLHGTSSLTTDQMNGLAADGVSRVNMWTRIAREAGQYAAARLASRMDAVKAGDFEAAEANAYLRDATEKAAEIMEGILGIIGYGKLG